MQNFLILNPSTCKRTSVHESLTFQGHAKGPSIRSRRQLFSIKVKTLVGIKVD